MSEQYYTLGTTQADHFDTVHDELTDGTLLGRAVECTDHKNHSPTKGEFLLTEAESETLRADDRILFINLTPARYPEIFNATEDDLRMDIQGSRYNRYGKPVRNYHYWASGGGYTGPDFAAAEEEDVSRASSQLIRPGQKRSPWIAQKNLEGVAFIKDPVQKGAGENVDGEYSIFVEIERSSQIANQITEMLFGISKITNIDDWKFTYYKNKEKKEATLENIKSVVPSSGKIYEQKMQKFRTDEVKSFFGKTLMDDLVLENNKIKILKPFDVSVEFEIVQEGDNKLIEGMEDIQVDDNATAEIFWLTKVMGDYNITKFGDKFLFTNESRSMVLKRI